MRNQDLWKPSKFVKYKNSYKATTDIKYVGHSYRFIADLQAKNYYELIKEHVSGDVLDLGCGNVSLYQMYNSFAKNIICADWPNSYHNSSFLDFQINLNKSLPIKDNRFDTILLTDVLEHILNPDLLLKEMTRILKPGGKMIIAVPFFHLLHEEPFDYYRYTEFRLKMFCQDNGLKLLKLLPYGASLEILIDFIAKHISFSLIFSKLNYSLGKFISNSFIGKKIYLLTSSKYPLGYCLVAQK